MAQPGIATWRPSSRCGCRPAYLVRKTHRVRPGDIVLVHAAAGGVGQVLSRWCKALGATVIGTAGSAAKCETARAAGCDVAIDYSQPGWVQRVIDATGGRKARVACIGARFDLPQAAQAHRLAEGRGTSGAIVMRA